jgi:tRNA threonylcarbamoyladenosine modification (KEOPS) complex  Pcc1 subunit
MICRAKILVYENPELVCKGLLPQTTKKDRSHLTIKKAKDSIEFDIKAKDLVAMRTEINAIMKDLMVFEKIRRIKD